MKCSACWAEDRAGIGALSMSVLNLFESGHCGPNGALQADIRLCKASAVKLVFLYGPPGTGKLTVAREVARLTGFKLFHNHLTVDLAASLFAHGSPEYMEYVRHLRYEAFERAARAEVSLVFTFWYSGVSEPSVARYRAIVEAQGGEVLFVRLWCRMGVLEARVANVSRQNWKISSVQQLRDALAEHPDSFGVISGTQLQIDNSDAEPDVVARQIVSWFGLSAEEAATGKTAPQPPE